MVFSGSRGRSCAREPPLLVSNSGVRSGHSWGWYRSDGGSAALAANTSHPELGRPRCRRQSPPHTRLVGKALRWRYSQRETQWGGVEVRKGHLECCSREWQTHVCVYSQVVVVTMITQTSLRIKQLHQVSQMWSDSTELLPNVKRQVVRLMINAGRQIHWEFTSGEGLELYNAFPFSRQWSCS